MIIRSLLILALALAAVPARATTETPEGAGAGLEAVLDRATAITPLETVVVAVDGERVAERGYRGHRVTAPTNIKSASKSVISLLVGIAIDRGVLEGPDQPIAPLLARDLPANADPRLATVTIGNLLSMQAGLERTSGANYGRWVSSGNWVRAALAQPFVAEPGAEMLYSTGSTHLLSAILTRKTGQSTLSLAREWLAPVDDFAISAWDRDPQGIYLGGNQMAMSPRSLLAFGELYRTGGRAPDGTQVVSAEWIETSWRQRTNSRFTGDGYGYGWFLRDIAGEPVRYAWGYGGQMLYVVPSLGLTMVMTSDDTAPAGRTGHRDALHALAGEIITAVAADAPAKPGAAEGAQSATPPVPSPPMDQGDPAP
ncbi:serine hydrolase [Pseudoxanthobacter sp. M-2]|uniref:serine hydrolase domain-containing protein n=1 Tax=Pseudoxanthobacter sp. M-2 TaxID=3078754 RepID=UPI0038FBEA2F